MYLFFLGSPVTPRSDPKHTQSADLSEYLFYLEETDTYKTFSHENA